MAQVLPAYGISLQEITRCRLRNGRDDADFISATQVRAAFLQRDFGKLALLVPDPTLEFLRSEEGEAVRQRLMTA